MGCRPKTALPYGRDSCIAWNRCHIFMNKRGTYGIIADNLRFALYTIGIHAVFINIRNPIPLQSHESPPIISIAVTKPF